MRIEPRSTTGDRRRSNGEPAYNKYIKGKQVPIVGAFPTLAKPENDPNVINKKLTKKKIVAGIPKQSSG